MYKQYRKIVNIVHNLIPGIWKMEWQSFAKTGLSVSSICKFLSQYFKCPLCPVSSPKSVYLHCIPCWVSNEHSSTLSGFIGLFLCHRKYQCCVARPSFAKWECQRANIGKYSVQAVKIFACQPPEGYCLNSTALLAFTPDSKTGTKNTFCLISYSSLQQVWTNSFTAD